MGVKIVSAVGSDAIYEYLREKKYEVIPDISYQEGVLKLIEKDFTDILIVYSELKGELDKYLFIDKVRQIDSKMKVIVIVDKEEDNYKSFLWSKGIFDIFINGVSSFECLEKCIEGTVFETRECDLSLKNIINIFSHGREVKNGLKSDLELKFHKQQIITFAGVGSSGKTTIATEVAKILADKIKAKVLLIDFDTVNAGINQLMGVKKGPENPGYILPPEKNSSLNYMIEAIDKRNFNTNIFEKFVIKSKIFSNLDILTGNKSLYVCKNILSSEYYSRILEVAKSLYDYILIDVSSNVFLDSMQFSVLNSTKVFVVAEGNYISMERTYRLLSELFPVWGVPDRKVQIIINKYSINSLDKTTIKEMLKEYEVVGYISFSGEYENSINNRNQKILSNVTEQFYSILDKADVILDNEFFVKKDTLKQRLLRLKRNTFGLKNV